MNKLVGALLTLLFVVVGASPAQAVTPPASIPSDCSGTSAQTALTAWIAGLPNGTATNPTVVDFPTNGCYQSSDRIEVRDKANIVFDGHGSTFRTSAENNGCFNRPNWMVLRGQGLTFKNLRVVGSFNPPASVQRSQANAINAATSCANGNQFNMGFSLYGG